MNIYAPNGVTEQQRFYTHLKDFLGRYANYNINLGGDFNCPLTPLNKDGGIPLKNKTSAISNVFNLCNTLNLKDVWRFQHLKEKRFTWPNKTLKVQCRLDYWLISDNIISQAKLSDIIPTSFSDHSAVTVTIQSNDYSKRGPGFFQFNNSLLQDKNFVSQLRENLPAYKNKYNEVEEKRLLWDLIKMELRSFIIYFAKWKAKRERNEEKTLQEQLCNLQTEMNPNRSHENIRKFYHLKYRLDEISLRRTQGTIVRSRARWTEHGQRNPKYFFNLGKRT